MKFIIVVLAFATHALAATVTSVTSNQAASISPNQSTSIPSNQAVSVSYNQTTNSFTQGFELSSIISSANQIDDQSSGIQTMSKSNKARMIISNKIAQSRVPLGKYAGRLNINSASNYNSCTEGTMFCDYYGNGFWTCAQGSYVYRDCGPGTNCKQQNGNLYCGYA